MSSFDRQLMGGEVVVLRAHLHPIVYLPALLVALLAAFVAVWLLPKGGDVRQAGAILAGLLACYALFLAAGGLIKRSSARFAVTNKRVLLHFGLVRRRSSEILLGQVEGITVHQAFWGRIFNYGSVRIEGTGGDREPFPKIAAPGAFRLAVQEQVELATRGSVAPPPPVPRTGEPAADRYSDLLRLDELRRKGVLSEEEFQREKRRVLGP
jgi:hypothetical protein